MPKRFQKAYPLLKALVSAAALCMCVHNEKPALLIAAFLFCIAGDILLALSGELHRRKREPYYSLGISAFEIAHIILSLCFITFGGFRIWFLIPALCLAAILPAGIHVGFFVPGSYGKRIVLYGILISIMVVSSIGQPYFTGAILFCVSDFLLSLWYFHPGMPFELGGLALLLYYGALFALAGC